MTPNPSDDELLRTFVSDRNEQQNNWGATLKTRIDLLRARVTSQATEPTIYLELAKCHTELRDHIEALAVLQEGVARFSGCGDLHLAQLKTLQESGLDQEALDVGERASDLLPGDYALKLSFALYLPKLYQSESDIHFYRARYERGLETCIAEANLRTLENAHRIARGFSRFRNFYLAYQGIDDVSLAQRYGWFVHRAMSAAFPQWREIPTYRTRVSPSRPKVGFISAYFRQHTIGEHFIGWLTDRRKQAYQAHCYYWGDVEDPVTEQYRQASDVFYKSLDFERMCAKVKNDELDVLLFTDVGINPVTSQMAALRLARTQCATYGHPTTTGLPTIDYFISGDSIEPRDADSRYTETLIRLPNLGICYQMPVLPRPLLTKKRSDFKLPDAAIVYLCCQSMFKYLPEYDHLLASIAAAVPNAQFVFLASNDLIAKKLSSRCDQAFAKVGLRAGDFCRILKEQPLFDYWNLNLVADVFLDAVGWSGGRSTLDAIACGLPVVTLPGQHMRSRQAAAVLKLLNVTETIAKDEDEFCALAIKLGRNKEWRLHITQTLTNNHASLRDQNVVTALESFIEEAAEN